MCVASGRTRVFSWSWSEGVVDVLPVAIRSAALCSLDFLNVCGGCVRGPGCVGVCEDGSNELIV